ncbi:uncharacterized protein BDW43DRAFT_303431 [Aspergillus alliaceus]|uniref:uncharacterized protein n=1 Tax=Petromyces alliaceus TaxID=209559 RepID=UPI0012A577CA|nr:uncharacterized protein BDW43DRAFT_303431 [Aspergillus alliaceus]KAB8228988.1 hypothetical protein BDW43DRAFT_303431 [Aspergillus alliaceus]
MITTPNSSPPSYNDLVDKVCQMVGSDPTPQKHIDAAAKLADNEINILMDNEDFSDLIKNKEDNKVFCTGAAKGLVSPEYAEHLKEVSNAAVDVLYLKIAQIDRIYRSDFGPTLIRNQLGKFNNLQINFTSFIADFPVWAKYREEELNREIAQAIKELEQLRKKIVSLNISILTLGGVAFLPVLTVLAACSGILGSFVMFGGLIALGVGAAAIVSMAALAIAKNKLIDVGKHKLEVFRVNVNMLLSVWTSVSADTWIISRYLNGALRMAEYLTNYTKGTPSQEGYP